MSNLAGRIFSILSITAMIVLVSACGGGGGGSESAGSIPATLVMTSSGGGAVPVTSSSGFVSQVIGPRSTIDPELIESLNIDITKVSIHRAGGESSEEESDIVDETEGSGWITLFEAVDPADVVTVDIIDLTFLSEVFTQANLPVGKYTKVAIYYENPIATLDHDGTEESPNITTDRIHTTANGRLFVSQNFTLVAGGPVLIVIDFEDIGLTDVFGNPSHDYVLTPQLGVSINVSSAAISVDGEIAGILEGPQEIAVDTGTTIVDVIVTDETTIVSEPPVFDDSIVERIDVQVPLTFEDLMLGDIVEIDGVVQLNGKVVADEIVVELELVM